MSAKFIPNPQCIPMIKRSKDLQDSLGSAANKIADTAKSIAPVRTGAYRDSIEGIDGLEKSEVLGRVIAKDFKAHWIEFGTTDTPTFAVLRKAAELNGYQVRDKRV